MRHFDVLASGPDRTIPQDSGIGRPKGAAQQGEAWMPSIKSACLCVPARRQAHSRPHHYNGLWGQCEQQVFGNVASAFPAIFLQVLATQGKLFAAFGLCGRRLKHLIARQQRPGRAHVLVGQGHGSHIHMLAL